MNKFKAFLARKDIEISARRYGIDALGPWPRDCSARCSSAPSSTPWASSSALTTWSPSAATPPPCPAPPWPVAIGYAPEVSAPGALSLIAVGSRRQWPGRRRRPSGGAGHRHLAAEFGKAVSKETKIDILVTPAVTIFVGVALSTLIAPPIGTAASWVGQLIMWATELQPFPDGHCGLRAGGCGPDPAHLFGGHLRRPGPHRSGRCCRGGRCAQMVGFAIMSFREKPLGWPHQPGPGHLHAPDGHYCPEPRIWIAPPWPAPSPAPSPPVCSTLEMNGAPVSSGMGTCGLVGQIGVYTGWVADVAAGTKAAITPWTGWDSDLLHPARGTDLDLWPGGAQAGLDQKREI